MPPQNIQKLQNDRLMIYLNQFGELKWNVAQKYWWKTHTYPGDLEKVLVICQQAEHSLASDGIVFVIFIL